MVFFMFLVTLFYVGSQKIGITRTSVLATMEPVFAAVFCPNFVETIFKYY